MSLLSSSCAKISQLGGGAAWGRMGCGCCADAEAGTGVGSLRLHGELCSSTEILLSVLVWSFLS